MKKIVLIVAVFVWVASCTSGANNGKKSGDTPVVKKDTGYRYDSSTQPHGIDKQ